MPTPGSQKRLIMVCPEVQNTHNMLQTRDGINFLVPSPGKTLKIQMSAGGWESFLVILEGGSRL